VSKLVSITPHRVKQQINEMGWDVHRTTKTSPIKIPPETVRKIIESRDMDYHNPKIGDFKILCV